MVNKQGNQRQSVLEQAGIALIILVITVLAFKFTAWNSWKLASFVETTGNVMKAPPAVNLTVLKKKTILYRESFAFNREGNFYIINGFDVTGHIDDDSFRLRLNDRTIGDFVLYRFTDFNILCFEDYSFVFTTEACKMETFVKLYNSARYIVNSLPRLAAAKIGAKKKLIHTLFKKTRKELGDGKGIFSAKVPVTFRKDVLYEIEFRYRMQGHGKPVIMLTPSPEIHVPAQIPVRHVPDTSVKGVWRKASILFRPTEDLDSPRLYLLLRVRKNQKGRVFFKNISFYRYEESYPWLGRRAGSGAAVTYMDFLNKLKKQFIELKIYKSS